MCLSDIARKIPHISHAEGPEHRGGKVGHVFKLEAQISIFNKSWKNLFQCGYSRGAISGGLHGRLGQIINLPDCSSDRLP